MNINQFYLTVNIIFLQKNTYFPVKQVLFFKQNCERFFFIIIIMPINIISKV